MAGPRPLFDWRESVEGADHGRCELTRVCDRQFNTGSPWNVPAGSGYTNIDQVVEKYQRESDEAQQTRLQQLKENKVPREQPLEPLVKQTAGSSQ